MKIKRIIDGKTFNTETATLIEGIDNTDEWRTGGDYLYQTRFGAFFSAWYEIRNGSEPEEGVVPLTPDEACRWLETNKPYRTDLIEALFGEMPEAGSAEVKYTLRMPEILRDRLASLAKLNDQSLNAWIVRCLESCAGLSVANSISEKK